MKKTALLFVACLLLAVSLLTVIPVRAEATSGTYGNLTWAYDEATATLTISGQGAMLDTWKNPWLSLASKCTAVVVNEGVTTLGEDAFDRFKVLTSVRLPSTLTTIGSGVFSGCSMLSQIRIPQGVTYVGPYCFSGCESLTDINIPNGVTEIKICTFSDCASLSKLTLPDSLETIEMNAFSGCWMLQEIKIPDSVTKLGQSAFSGCISLESITLSKQLKEIGNNAFMDCTSLGTIVIPDEVTKLCYATFSGCSSLTDVTIGAGVAAIEMEIFRECYALENIEISSENPCLFAQDGVIYTADREKLILAKPNLSGSYAVLPGTETIREKSFYQCVYLTDVILPDSVKCIEKEAFRRCISLKSVELGSGLQYIRDVAFNSTALTAVVLPETVTVLGSGAFSDCNELKEVRFRGGKPDTIASNAFVGVTATVYYRNDGSWHKIEDYGGNLRWEPFDCKGNHTVAIQPGKAATCTEDGITEGSVCSACGETLKAQTVISATGHSYGDWIVVTPATTETAGKSQRSCSVCGRTEKKTIARQLSVVESAKPGASSPENAPTQTVLWVVIGIVTVVVVADVIVSLIYLKKRKKPTKEENL